MRIAAIDIGTVTTRLLVADVTEGDDGPHLDEFSRDLELTHLGEGLDASGELSASAIDRVAEAVARFVDAARRAGVERVATVATSATRDARNADALTSRLTDIGAHPEIVSGEREARLSFAGAAHSLAGDGLLVADLGGGSTELIFGTAGPGGRPRVVRAESFDVGSKRMTERVLPVHPPSADALARAREWALSEMRPFFDALPGEPTMLVSLAGTVTTLAAIEKGLAVYDSQAVHGSSLTAEDLRSLEDLLAPMTLEELRVVPGLHPGRASVIVAGTVILRAVLELTGLNSTMVSEHDILYGIALDAFAGGGRR